MAAAAASLEYERAALLRDQIMELKNGTGISKIEPKKRPAKVSYSKGSRNGAPSGTPAARPALKVPAARQLKHFRLLVVARGAFPRLPS